MNHPANEIEVVPWSEVQRRLGICRALAYRGAQHGEIPAVKIGRRTIVLREPFERFMRGEDHTSQNSDDG